MHLNRPRSLRLRTGNQNHLVREIAVSNSFLRCLLDIALIEGVLRSGE
jgi:hypothetical protein